MLVSWSYILISTATKKSVSGEVSAITSAFHSRNNEFCAIGAQASVAHVMPMTPAFALLNCPRTFAPEMSLNT